MFGFGKAPYHARHLAYYSHDLLVLHVVVVVNVRPLFRFARNVSIVFGQTVVRDLGNATRTFSAGFCSGWNVDRAFRPGFHKKRVSRRVWVYFVMCMSKQS